MASSRIPQLAEDGSRLDWPDANYTPDIKRRGAETKITVEHVLKGATSLSDAVRSGKAVWQTEVRCPRLLHSEHFIGADDRQGVEWDANMVDWEGTFVLPSMASRGHSLSTIELVGTAWAPGETIDVPAGALLAKADVRRLKPLMQSLLLFRKDETLGDGQMRVVEDSASDTPCFVVYIAENVFAETRWNRDRRIAALIGAFSAMASSESRMQPDKELWEHPVTKELRRVLLEEGSLTWDESGFDCVHAATLLEPMTVADPSSLDSEHE